MQETSEQPAGSNEEAEWKRLSPLSIVDFFVTMIRQGVAQALPALVVVLASAATSERLELAWIIAALVLLLILLAVYGVLAYLRYGYQLVDGRINVRKGVLIREVLNIDRDRIQNITIHEPFYFRPFSLAAIGIDTAGSSGKEIRLPGIPVLEARVLRNQLVNSTGAPTADAQHDSESQGESAVLESTGAPVHEGTVLLTLSRKDVLIAGLTANFMLWAAIALGTLFGSGEYAEQSLGWLTQEFDVREAIDRAKAEGRTISAGLLALGLVFVALILLPTISMLGALFRYDGYLLTEDGDRFRRTSGLLSRHDESVRQHKIQAVTWKQNLMARLFKRINLQLRQASAGTGLESGDVSAAMLKQTFPVPSLRPAEAESLTARFLPGYLQSTYSFTRVNLRRYLTISPALILTPLAIALGLMGTFIDWRWAALWVPLAAIVMLIHLQCWRQTGWAVNGDHGMLKTGFIGSTITVFPLYKVQRVDVTQTPAMRRKGLAHLTVHLASHSTSMPWVDARDAMQFRDLAINAAQRSEKAWF